MRDCPDKPNDPFVSLIRNETGADFADHSAERPQGARRRSDDQRHSVRVAIREIVDWTQAAAFGVKSRPKIARQRRARQVYL